MTDSAYRQELFVHSHIGICVSDLTKAIRFYRDGLGFRVTEYFEVGNEIAPLIRYNGSVLIRSQFMKKGELRIDLMNFIIPAPEAGDSNRSVYTKGLVNMSFRVLDLEKAISDVERAGGAILADTKCHGLHGKFIYCADPDGTPIELMEIGAGVLS